MSEVIFEERQRSLKIQRSSIYTPSFVKFLERTVWGSGGVQYIMHQVAGTLNRLKNPHFLSLTENDELVAVSTLNQKTIQIGGKTCPACYSYGIAVDAAKRGLGYGTLMAKQRLQYGLSKLGEKGLFYGYIEASNTNSLKTITKVGSKSLGQYQILLISRLRPATDARLEKMAESKRETLVQLLSEQYADHALLDIDQSVNLEDYYILRHKGDIIAGVQIARQHLTIKHLPGASGLILVKMLPHIPMLRRLFPDGNFHFLTFGNLYAPNGREAEIFTLMEALLARSHLNFGLLYLDLRSPIYHRLKSVDKFGVFHALIDVPVHVMAYFKGFAAKEIADFCRQPLFISMLDPV